MEAAGRHLGRRKWNPSAVLLQQNSIRKETAENTGAGQGWCVTGCSQLQICGGNPGESPTERSSWNGWMRCSTQAPVGKGLWTLPWPPAPCWVGGGYSHHAEASPHLGWFTHPWSKCPSVCQGFIWRGKKNNLKNHSNIRTTMCLKNPSQEMGG